jgi:rhamnopyranosyl-N-acetylglucosaminyl-diphospho-decaprenol beta-1,3/1,4-galactofuranosyltransferase
VQLALGSLALWVGGWCLGSRTEERTRRLPDTLSGVTEGPAIPRIVAVVVTFNRLPLLQRLVARLAETEGLAEVLVVDNASTDGTGEWLAAQPPPVRTLSLPDNRGGAGGFHAGLQQALDDGADLVWLMDDDGIPEADCLKILLGQEDLDFWGPAVLAEQDHSRLCFPIRLPGRATVVHRMVEVEQAARDGVIADVVIPFNGVLVTRELVERIGTPREEFFIWGDDVEYLWRARRDGARTGTVVAARFLHPATDDLGTPMAFGRTTYNHSPSDLKHYCMARNNLVNLRDYRGWPAALAFVAKTAWFYTFTRPSPARLALSARAMYAGLRGDFTGHRRFLRG